jgi:serine/threonine-protein kinase HipA
MTLAKKAGISTPDFKLLTVGGRDIFLVKRFDRELNNSVMIKRHFISAMTALQINDVKAWLESYQNIADTLRKFCVNPQRMGRELYRRMVYNGCCNNTDDHLLNHGFLRTKRGWELSPAYDIVAQPSMGLSPNSSYLNLGKQGKLVSEENLLNDVGSFGLTLKLAREIFDEVLAASESWYDVFADCGVKSEDIAAFEGTFSGLKQSEDNNASAKN